MQFFGLPLTHAAKLRLYVESPRLAFGGQGNRPTAKKRIVGVEKGNCLILPQDLKSQTGYVALPSRLIPRNRKAARTSAPMRRGRALVVIAYGAASRLVSGSTIVSLSEAPTKEWPSRCVLDGASPHRCNDEVARVAQWRAADAASRRGAAKAAGQCPQWIESGHSGAGHNKKPRQSLGGAPCCRSRDGQASEPSVWAVVIRVCVELCPPLR